MAGCSVLIFSCTNTSVAQRNNFRVFSSALSWTFRRFAKKSLKATKEVLANNSNGKKSFIFKQIAFYRFAPPTWLPK